MIPEPARGFSAPPVRDFQTGFVSCSQEPAGFAAIRGEGSAARKERCDELQADEIQG